jgi:hypothetical protein
MPSRAQKNQPYQCPNLFDGLSPFRMGLDEQQNSQFRMQCVHNFRQLLSAVCPQHSVIGDV